MEPPIKEPYNRYVEMCGCIWKQRRRVHTCNKHQHKDEIMPNKIFRIK